MIGSLVYLAVSLHDFAETLIYYRNNRRHGRKTILEFLTVTGYVIASVLFLLGSVFPAQHVQGSLGSLGFHHRQRPVCCGRGHKRDSDHRGKHADLPATPERRRHLFRYWLDSVSDPLDSLPLVCRRVQPHAKLFTYLAAQFIFASLLFLAGGVANFYRAYRMHYYRASNGNYENEDQ